MSDIYPRESIAIVGGGITGIVAAIELAKSRRFRVTIFEKENQLGGLSSYYQWKDVICDRFYHVILSNDTNLISFINELGLESELFWRKAKSGFYKRGKLASFSSILDFIQFPFLSVWQKFRLGLGVFYITKIKNLSRLDKIDAQQWLTKVFGHRIYNNIWEPLLRSKLGDVRDRTSAAFIWATISRLYGTRSLWSKCEKMGHVQGGYYTIWNAAQKKLSELNVEVLTKSPVFKADLINNSRTYQDNKQIVVASRSGTFKFDKLLFTTPNPVVMQILDSIDNHPFWRRLRDIEYLSIACVLLTINRRLSPYYVINLIDEDMPFTGIIESTNIVSPHEIGNKHLIYLPKYMSKDDPIDRLSDNQIIRLFVDKLQTVFPDLKNDEILHKNIFTEKYVQPLQELNFLNRSHGFRTPLPNVYIANASMIQNSTLNNNAAVNLARKVAKKIIADSAKKVTKGMQIL